MKGMSRIGRRERAPSSLRGGARKPPSAPARCRTAYSGFLEGRRVANACPLPTHFPKNGSRRIRTASALVSGALRGSPRGGRPVLLETVAVERRSRTTRQQSKRIETRPPLGTRTSLGRTRKPRLLLGHLVLAPDALLISGSQVRLTVRCAEKRAEVQMRATGPRRLYLQLA